MTAIDPRPDLSAFGSSAGKDQIPDCYRNPGGDAEDLALIGSRADQGHAVVRWPINSHRLGDARDVEQATGRPMESFRK